MNDAQRLNAPASWLHANQALLAAEFLALRVRLGESALADEAQAALQDAQAALASPAAIDQICALFELSTFERQILLLCAGCDMDACVAAACGGTPTFGLALAALDQAYWSALTPEAPLRRWRLVEPESGATLTGAALRIDERLLHTLAGLDTVDARLRPLLRAMEVPPLSASQHALVTRVAQQLGLNPVVQLCGSDAALAEDLALAVAAQLDRRLLVVRETDLPVQGYERARWLALLAREAMLLPAIVLLDGCSLALDAVAQLAAPVLVHAAEPLRGRMPVHCETYGRPLPTEQRQLWTQALGGEHSDVQGSIDALSAQFRLGARDIEAAASDARQRIAAGASIPQALWQAARARRPQALDELASRIDTRAGWDALVLPAPALDQLQQLVAQARNRLRVHEDWGFAGNGERGLGITALFAGESGTGKTLAAEVIANELQLTLYRIDLSGLVSKYIGETEKNLRRVFDAAEDAGAVLLFDEADALFGKRSEVKDSHDRYANIEVSYLLQRMEAYRGLAILTTNLKSALDPAFQRRLRFVVQFPFPDAVQREKLWRQAFPPQAPLAALDYARLAQLQVAGGAVRNIALNAAMLACARGSVIDMEALREAARAEASKFGRALSEAELRGWS